MQVKANILSGCYRTNVLAKRNLVIQVKADISRSSTAAVYCHLDNMPVILGASMSVLQTTYLLY